MITLDILEFSFYKLSKYLNVTKSNPRSLSDKLICSSADFMKSFEFRILLKIISYYIIIFIELLSGLYSI